MVRGRTAWGLAFLGLLMVSPKVAKGSGSNVTLGEVVVESPHSQVDAPALRRASVEELDALDMPKLPRDRRAVLSVSLVRVVKKSGGFACSVSAVLRDAKKGTLFAVLEGHAEGDTRAGNAEEHERQIVRSALHGAITRVPDVMR